MIFIEKYTGYVWFKHGSRSIWFDHPKPDQAKAARRDLNGVPQLAGLALEGRLISDQSHLQSLKVVAALVEMQIPGYVIKALEARLERAWPFIRGEFESLAQVYRHIDQARCQPSLACDV